MLTSSIVLPIDDFLLYYYLSITIVLNSVTHQQSCKHSFARPHHISERSPLNTWNHIPPCQLSCPLEERHSRTNIRLKIGLRQTEIPDLYRPRYIWLGYWREMVPLDCTLELHLLEAVLGMKNLWHSFRSKILRKENSGLSSEAEITLLSWTDIEQSLSILQHYLK